MQIRAKVRFYRKRDPRKGEWYQAVLYVRSEDRDKLKPYDGQEITIYIGETPTVECQASTVEENSKKKELLEALTQFFIKAFSDKSLAKKLIKIPEANRVLELLEGDSE